MNYRNQKLDTLQIFSLIYLGLPLLLFFISWLKWYYALFFCACILITFFSFKYDFRIKVKLKHFIYFILFTLFLIFLGYGEIFPQSGDWAKHNAIFSELFANWNNPVFHLYNGQKHFLCYGLGFYMLPSWIAGLFNSFFLLQWMILFNSAIGLSLIALWITRIWNIPLWGTLLIFLLASFDWMKDLHYVLKPEYSLGQISLLADLHFISRIDQTPQHGIPKLLSFLAIFYSLFHERNDYLFAFCIIVFGFFWSPFIVFALLPLVLFIKLKFIKSLFTKTSLKIFLPFVVIFVCLLLYYKAHLPLDKVSLEVSWLKKLIYRCITRYSLTYGLNLLIIFFINWKIKFMKPIEVVLILGFLIINLTYKQINYGFYSDFQAKTSYLIDFILNIYLIKALILYFKNLNWITKSTVCFYLFFLTFVPLTLLYIKISSIYVTYREWNPFLLSDKRNITLEEALQDCSMENEYPFIKQYLGKKNKSSSILFK